MQSSEWTLQADIGIRDADKDWPRVPAAIYPTEPEEVWRLKLVALQTLQLLHHQQQGEDEDARPCHPHYKLDQASSLLSTGTSFSYSPKIINMKTDHGEVAPKCKLTALSLETSAGIWLYSWRGSDLTETYMQHTSV
ncbi:unnamed protein product [Caretta caretta]